MACLKNESTITIRVNENGKHQGKVDEISVAFSSAEHADEIDLCRRLIFSGALCACQDRNDND